MKRRENMRRRENMKRTCAGLLSIALAGAMALPVHAASTAKDTTLNYTQATTYMLNIPADITLSAVSEQTLALGVSAVNTRPDEKVVVKCTDGIDASGDVTLTRTGGGTTKVKISQSTGGTGITTADVLAVFEDQTTTAKSGGTLYVAAVGDVNAGTYAGKVTFTGSIESR